MHWLRLGNDELFGRAWFIDVDGTTASIAAFFDESNKANIDKVGESIRILK